LLGRGVELASPELRSSSEYETFINFMADQQYGSSF